MKCGACIVEDMRAAPTPSAPFLAALSDAAVAGLDKVIGDLCPLHRARYDTFKVIHEAVRAVLLDEAAS